MGGAILDPEKLPVSFLVLRIYVEFTGNLRSAPFSHDIYVLSLGLSGTICPASTRRDVQFGPANSGKITSA